MTGKTVLVTGAAKGIGRGIAQRFLEGGWAVALFDIDCEGLATTAAELSACGRVLALEGDVASAESARAAVFSTMEGFGRLDALVNNAGIEIGGRVDELSPEQWDRQLGVNLRGAFLMSKYAIPHLRGRGGSIVNISSVHAFYSYAACPAYDASKAGLIGLTRTMAIDHGRDGIRVNAICPGYIDTPLLRSWLDHVPDATGAMAEVLKAHPLGRIGTPRDIAEACYFLASDAAAFISGTYLIVDGAMTVPGH
jgi:NAD(P)-dependent dehydrogenase (short-subunit alcohol dehydrogenase family)